MGLCHGHRGCSYGSVDIRAYLITIIYITGDCYDDSTGPIVCMQFNHWVIASGSTDK